MPSGSYTDGHANTVAADRISMTSSRGSMSRSQKTPSRAALSSATSDSISAAISGVSGAPAHNTNWASGWKSRAARTRCGTPFCRVIRPTNATIGRSGSTPWRRSTESSPENVSTGAHTAVSMPLRITWMRPGSTSG